MFFLDPAAPDFYADWDRVAPAAVAGLRASAGADLDDPRLTELVGELTLSYESFAASGAPGQLLTVYHAEPDTPSGQALALLSSLAAGEPSSSAPTRTVSRP